jgi:hypothetical protein
VIDRRLLDAARTPARSPSIPVLVGACGSGRTERLLRLHRELGAQASQYIDIERIATTPERCFRAVVGASPFATSDEARADAASGARQAFDGLLLFLMNATDDDGSPVTFLLDEVLELRTFESFPGLRTVLPELARALANSPNRFILSTRFAARASRWIETAPDRFELVMLAPLAATDVRDTLTRDAGRGDGPHQPGPGGYAAYAEQPGASRHDVVLDSDVDDLAHTVQLLADGRPMYVRALLETLTTLRRGGGGDAISALAAALARGGELDSRCRFSYELRLHRARGYGALKAILDVLSEEEPLTLTQIAQRLGRTPGSTKDYLSWLQDVDLLTSHRKRYSFTDPLLRLWVRVHGHAVPADDERLAREAQEYAMKRLQMAPPTAVALAIDHASKVDAPRSEATRAEATRAEATRAETTRAESNRVEASRVETAVGAGAARAGQGGLADRALPRAAGAASGIIEID